MLTRINPFSVARPSAPMPAFDELFHEADSLLRSSLFADTALPANWTARATFVPPADVVETAEALEVKLDLPGHDPKTLQVRLEGQMLTVSSERRQEKPTDARGWVVSERAFGAFSRTFSLPSSVDTSRSEARFEHGVLTITLPRREEAKPRSIAVKVT